MEFVVVDIETTGLSPDINEIIEIGAVRVKQTSTGFEITERYEQLIKPYHDIPIVVRQLTGIDEDMLKDSPRFAAVADTFLRFVGTSTFVAHNAIFDLRTINESLNAWIVRFWIIRCSIPKTLSPLRFRQSPRIA